MQKLTQNRIESISVTKIEDICNSSSKLQVLASKGDKTPSFDGEIIVRNKPTDKKEDIIGYVDIQIKGTQVEKLSTKEISFSVDVADLKNFLHKNGVMFFCVEVFSNKKTRVFYNSLLPYDLNLLLNSANENKQKTKTIKLKKLDSKKIFDICKKFIYDKEYQNGLPCVTEKDLSRFEDFRPSLIPFGTLKKSLKKMLGSDIYVTAKQKDTKQQVVFDKINIDSITETTNQPILVNDKKHYDRFEIVYKQNNKIIKVGKSITINTKEPFETSVCLKGSVVDRIKDLEFLIDWINTGIMHIGPNTVFIQDNSEKLPRFVELCNHFKNVSSVLERIGLDCNLEFEDFTVNNTAQTIDQLIKSVIHKENIIKMTTTIKVLKVRICNYVCAIFFIDKNGIQEVYNYFDLHKHVIRVCEDEDKKQHIIPCYYGSKSNEWLMFDNFKLSSCEESIKNSDINTFTFEMINQLFLEMLYYYDATKKDEDYECCMRTINYLNGKSRSYTPFKINLYQTIKRHRQLTIDEKEILRKLYKKRGNDRLTLICISVLLENQADIECDLTKLSTEEIKIFKSWPIYNLLNEQQKESLKLLK